MMLDIVAKDDEEISVVGVLHGLKFLVHALEANLREGEVYHLHTCSKPIVGGIYLYQRHVHSVSSDPTMPFMTARARFRAGAQVQNYGLQPRINRTW